MKTVNREKKELQPNVHFNPKYGWINDPNGCVYSNGIYHLFYQHNPNSSLWGPMHWGHCESTDLVSWVEKDIAIYPDEKGFIFSGSGISDAKNISNLFKNSSGLLFFYTSHIDEGEGEFLQEQCIAYSRDNGKTFEKYEGNPVVKNPGIKDFRDPKVFYDSMSEQWIMLIAAGNEIIFYSSKNLLDWNSLSSFSSDLIGEKDVWECPDLFKIEDDMGETHWVLSACIILDHPESKQLYFIGGFDGKNFRPYNTNKLEYADLGFDFYAAQSWSNLPENGPQQVWIAWANNWSYADKTPELGWRGMFTFARELSIRKIGGSYSLIQNPVKEIGKLRTKLDKDYKNCITEYTEIDLLGEDSIEICFNKIVISENSCIRVEFFWSSGDSFLIYLCEDGFLFDRSRSCQMFNRSRLNKIHCRLPYNQKLDFFHLFIDKSITEIYLNHGLVTATNLIFPQGELCKMIISPDEKSKIQKSEIYALSIKK